ncbi:MAG: aminoacyltransferase [Bacteroidales bacterium]|nr:aminoacyltransferase [Bacteroidales bacterium]
MEILLNDSIPLRAWREFLSGNPYATPFQSPGFYNLFNSVKNLSAEAIAVTDSESIRALAVVTLQREPGIKGIFSRRGIIYGGPIVDDDYPEALEMLLKQISAKLERKAIYIETRNFSDYSLYKDNFLSHGFRYVHYLNFHIATCDMGSMCAAVSSSRMRQVKKAQRNSVTWEEAENIDEIKIFYDILSNLYRYKIGKPLLPVELFTNFFESGLGKYLLIWYKNKIIGGIMCPILEGKSIYEFYICGLDEEYKEQYPSVMATWAAMEYANQNNIPVFDFMGAGKPDGQYGVREFKARFGGESVEYGRFMKINNLFLYNMGEFGLKIMKVFNK